MTNEKSYNTLCFNVLNILLGKLDIQICYINRRLFNTVSLAGNLNGHSDLDKDQIVMANCAFIAKNKKTNFIFSFGHQGVDRLQKLSHYVFSIDDNKFKNIHIIIFKDSDALDEARQINKASTYKRSFFTSFYAICEKALEIDRKTYDKLLDNEQGCNKSLHNYKSLASLHKIEIIDNIPVGNKDHKIYKLAFISDDAVDILPGQFIMISTLKEQKAMSKYYKPKILTSLSESVPDILNNLQTRQISFLKRPFGIYRTYHENFDHDYLLKLNIEKELVSVLYIIKARKFEIVYKVLENGIGTNELTRLTEGDKLEILAPLGKIFDLRELVKEDIDEIHIVGGGVGIAPLVYLVQMLRYLNIKTKAFVGVEDYDALIYKNNRVKGHKGPGTDSKIYIDDLTDLGLSRSSDIFLSFLCNTDREQITDLNNVFNGNLVTEPYAEYIKQHKHLKIYTFSCGPVSMMKKVHELTAQYNIKSYVLMEKRMACGIGVCFSCVCKTIKNGETHNSRVCIEGPIIESKQIDWNE
ncbi:MAG: hypothetical protein JXK95_12360 [Bacteroidales bacterium]|nr:hypothetical protein [Bacteroidales bacterium]